MDTKPVSTLLSGNCKIPTVHDLSERLVWSESDEQSCSGKHLSNINITELLDDAVIGLKPAEARFQNVTVDPSQIIPVSLSDDLDSDELLSFDGSPVDEEIPFELEQSLLDYKCKNSQDQKDCNCSTNTISAASGLNTARVSHPPSGNLDTNNNNLSCLNQTLIGSDSRAFEDEVRSEIQIQVKSEYGMSMRVNSERNVNLEGQGFNCASSSNKILDSNQSPAKLNLKCYSNSVQNNNPGNTILETDSKTGGSNFFGDGTIDGENVNKMQVFSESQYKSEFKYRDLSHGFSLEISEILKDCNDNTLDLEFDNEILSLEPVDIKENVETLSGSVKSDLPDIPQELKTHLKKGQSSDPGLFKQCVASQCQDGSSSIFQPDLMEENQQSKKMTKKNSTQSCSLPKRRTSLSFVPAHDFETKLNGNKNCKILPQTSVMKTTLEGDRMKILVNENVTSPDQNNVRTAVQVSPAVKNKPTEKEKVLGQRPQFNIDIELGKCSSQCEDSMVIRDLKDRSKIDKATTFTSVKTPLEHSGDSVALKTHSVGVKKNDVERLLMKDGRSLINSNILKVNPRNLCKNTNPELINLMCQNPVASTRGSPLLDCQNLTQKMHPSAKKPLKNKLENKSSQDDNQFRNSNNPGLCTFDQASLTSNKSKQQHFGKNCAKDIKREPEESLENISENNNKNLKNQKMRADPLIISVKNDNSNQKRVVKLGSQFNRGDISSVTHRNREIIVKPTLNEENRSMKEKTKYNQIKTVQNFNQSCTNSSGIDYILKDIVDTREYSNNTTKPVARTSLTSSEIPTRISLVAQSQLLRSGESSTKINNAKQKGISQKNSAQPSNIPQGVKKHKRSKSSKKRAKTLLSLSKMGKLSTQSLVENANTLHVSTTQCKDKTCSAANFGNISRVASSSSSLSEPTRTQDVDSTNTRKFVKAKRVLDKQKQLSALLEGDNCLDDCQIDNRVQWVCCRWNVKTLSNQDINLTTAAYIRSQLPTKQAACFQGSLEGQKDYTLAIVAPNRKRRLYQDNNSTDGDDSLGQASKKRRLSKEVQLIPDHIKDLQPNLKLFNKQLIDKLIASQNMSLAALGRQKNQELNLLDEQYHCLQYQLQEKQFQEQQLHGYFGYHDGYAAMYQLQSEHNYQHHQLDLTMHRKYNDLVKRFAEEEKRLRTQHKMSLKKIKAVLSEDVSDSDCLTIALRKGPSRTNNYKITYQTVTLSPHVALAMIREDEIYDSFYNHTI